MSDQTQASLAQKTISADKLLVSREDQEILRRLAGRVASWSLPSLEEMPGKIFSVDPQIPL